MQQWPQNLYERQKFQSCCSYFQKDDCRLPNCKREHKYEPCPDYDKGFCYRGPNCPKKHVVRKLCMDYIYGFCKDGPDCKLQHVKLYEPGDSTRELKFTEQFYKLLKETNYYREFPDFKPVICNSCQEVGHKSNMCKQNMRMSPTRIILCGICETEHPIQLQGKLPNCQYQPIKRKEDISN